jgi:RimJ/RimL family protein N-acetyltransferase
MNYATIEDFDEVWLFFKDNKEWFPHVRKFHIRNRLAWGQVILEDGILITQQQYKRTGPIGRNTDVITKKGDYIIHQIVAKKQGNGSASKVIQNYFDYVDSDVWLTVRENNTAANKFYEKVGMEQVGKISWAKGKMPGLVWKKEKGDLTNGIKAGIL